MGLGMGICRRASKNNEETFCSRFQEKIEQ